MDSEAEESRLRYEYLVHERDHQLFVRHEVNMDN
jgi:hypothetical protein